MAFLVAKTLQLSAMTAAFPCFHRMLHVATGVGKLSANLCLTLHQTEHTKPMQSDQIMQFPEEKTAYN